MSIGICFNFVIIQSFKQEWNLIRFCACIDTGKIYIGFVKYHFPKLCNRVIMIRYTVQRPCNVFMHIHRSKHYVTQHDNSDRLGIFP